MSNESIESLARRLAESLPEGLKALRDDAEQNFRSVLSAGVSKLDLVTREEFDVQQAVLSRTRQKLDELQARLAELEAPDAKPTKKPASPRKKAGKKKKAPAASKAEEQ